MRFRVLGPVECVDDDGSTIAVTSPTQRVILAVLLANRDEVVRADTLVDAIWGAAPPASASGSLRTYLSRLRRVLGPRLVTCVGGWMLTTAGDEVDAATFTVSIAQDGNADVLAAALAAWRGSAYAGHEHLRAVQAEAARLDLLRRLVRERHAAALLAERRAQEAAVAAESLTVEEPLAEAGWITLIGALAGTGRHVEALRSYQEARRHLGEVGLEPSSALRAAEAAVSSGTTAPAGGTRPSLARNVDVPVTSLVGREHALARAASLLEEHRLVTIVGPGGVGKTRLALEVARRYSAGHAVGCCMIELSRLQPDDVVEDAVVDALGLMRGGQTVEETLDRAAALDLLVVLDNCEHLLLPVARIADRLLHRGTVLRMVATSRERLGVPGERVLPLDPLGIEPGGDASVLLEQRAEAVGAAPSTDTALTQRILHRLDGLPLAIEMAAGLLDALSYGELADLLDTEVDLLRSATTNADPRHRTLAAAIAWSVQLLDAQDRHVFAAISVFAGPVTLRDIEGVVGGDEVFASVRRLVARSLLAADVSGDVTRYRLLEPIRAHASRLLDPAEAATLRERHARRFLELARTADRALRTAEEAEAHHRLDAAFAELRAAHRWARSNAPRLAGELTDALQVWAYTRARDECFAWAEQALDGVAVPEPALLAAVATRASYDGRLEAALRHGVAAIDAAPESAAVLQAYCAVADAYTYAGDLEQAIVWSRRGAALGQELGDLHHRTMGSVNASIALTYLGRQPEALRELAGLTALALGPTSEALVEFGHGEALADTAPDDAIQRYRRARVLADQAGSRFIAGVASTALVALLARHGDPATALPAFAEVIEHWRQTSADVHQLTALRNLPTLLQRVGAALQCASLLAAIDHDQVSPTFGDEAARLAAARAWSIAELGPTEFERVARAIDPIRTVDAAARTALRLLEELSPSPDGASTATAAARRS